MNELIRPIEEQDLEQLKELHQKQGADYPFPDLMHPLFVIKLAVVRDGKVLMTLLGKLTLELHLLLDKEIGTPGERWRRIIDLGRAAEIDAYERLGLEDCYCCLPDTVDMWRFRKRVESLGFMPVRDGTLFYKYLVGGQYGEQSRIANEPIASTAGPTAGSQTTAA